MPEPITRSPLRWTVDPRNEAQHRGNALTRSIEQRRAERAVTGTRSETEADREAEENLRPAAGLQHAGGSAQDTASVFSPGDEYLGYVIDPALFHDRTPRNPPVPARSPGSLRTRRTARSAGEMVEVLWRLGSAEERAAERAARQRARRDFIQRMVELETEPRRVRRAWVRRRHREASEEARRREEDREDYEEVQRGLGDVRGSMDLSYEGNMALLEAMGYAEEVCDP